MSLLISTLSFADTHDDRLEKPMLSAAPATIITATIQSLLESKPVMMSMTYLLATLEASPVALHSRPSRV